VRLQIPAIVNAFEKAKSLKGKPILINIRTIIGIGSQNQNTGKVHGAALGPDDVRQVKQQLGFDPDADFHVPETIYEYFKDCKPKGQKKEDEWNAMLAKYANEYPEEYKELKMRMSGKFAEGDEWKDLLPTKADLPQAAQPTRKSSGIVVQALVPKYKSFLAGSADLLESTFVNFKGQVEFQKPDSGLGDYSGRQIRYGIREFAMVAIGNGMAAYQKGMIIPYVHRSIRRVDFC
jgi:dihydroxyacetone synthase